MLVFVATDLHWFNPFVYRMAQEIALQCELSCDEEVIKHSDTNNRQQYVEAIIGVMKKHSRRQSVFSTSFSDSRMNMKRVLSIMDNRSKKWGIFILIVIVLATIGTGAVLHLSPTKSEIATPEPTSPIIASGSVAEQEVNKPPTSLADPVSPVDNAKGKQNGTNLESVAPERDTPVSNASPILIPVTAPAQKPSVPVSSEAERGEKAASFLFADPGISHR